MKVSLAAWLSWRSWRSIPNSLLASMGRVRLLEHSEGVATTAKVQPVWHYELLIVGILCIGPSRVIQPAHDSSRGNVFNMVTPA